MIKSRNFEHQVNSVIPVQTVEVLIRSRLFTIFTVCLVFVFFPFQCLKYETNKVAVRIYLMSKLTWLSPNQSGCFCSVWLTSKGFYQSPLILTEWFQHNLISVSYFTACYLYQAWWRCTFLTTSLMTLNQHKNKKLRHNRYIEGCSTMGKLINRIPGIRWW